MRTMHPQQHQLRMLMDCVSPATPATSVASARQGKAQAGLQLRQLLRSKACGAFYDKKLLQTKGSCPDCASRALRSLLVSRSASAAPFIVITTLCK